jgi:glycosyltransferase involved in cell wall biosynthesis
MNENVAIKIPLFNSEDTILDTLHSLLNQTYKNIVIYIYDNCSTDKSENLIHQINDKRIIYFKHSKNHGWNFNFNYCLKDTGEKYLLIAHADDIYDKNFIKFNITSLRKSDCKMMFTEGVSFRTKYPTIVDFDSNNLLIELFDHKKLYEQICQRGNFLYCPTAFSEMKIFINTITSFNGDLFDCSADLDAWLIFTLQYKIGLIKNKGLFYHRISTNQLSTLDRKKSENHFSKCLIHYNQLSSDNFVVNNDYITWHSIFHQTVYAYYSEKPVNFIETTKKILLLKINGLKKIKLISLITYVNFSIILPKQLQLFFKKIIIKKIR